MGIEREMRRLCADLVTGLGPPTARSSDLCVALCAAMGERRGRPVVFRAAAFPAGTASGLWLDLADQDVVVVEERTAPEHQLVILGHELWHMNAGHQGRDGPGGPVTTRLLGATLDERALRETARAVAARTDFDAAEEREAERFGLLLASKCRAWSGGSSSRDPGRRDHLAGRIEASLGYLR
ncbi:MULTISPECIES: toxin-antitoxin system, toxin component [unclassified Streptomyces]|uniref:toxin-antitoxin system, toxin component n=1 Tax=unclassified Streptomyces TaxID=2593676 RepID=UPI001F5BDCC1|nr:toxin-antitoxin system, toxin component [Streptomyces sp. HSG2]